VKGGFRFSRKRNLTVGLRVKRKGGFTIVELVVALAIMGIAVSAAIPGFSRWLPGYRLKGAATHVYASMQSAKMFAIRDSTDWSLCFSTDFEAFFFKRAGVQVSEPKPTWMPSHYKGVIFGYGNATDSIPSSGSPPAGAVTFPFSAPYYEVTFNARGLANAEGYVYLQNENNATYAVGTLTTGLILMRKWTGTAWE
jgi:prepilin-type N-terminal cleavage/methylation domain-containing protein